MKKAKDQPESEPAELASLVGERIRKIRKEEGLSLELFALRCDMNAAYVGHIERGVQNPTLNTLEHICKGLDISVEGLFHRYDSDAYPEDVRYEYVALEELTTRFRISFNYQLEQMPDNAQRDVILEIIHKHKDYLTSLEAALADVKDQTA